MPTLPNYCDLLPEVNSVPAEADMVLFKPYFEIPTGCTSFDVSVKVPSGCYEISTCEPGYPGGGKCCSNQDHNQLIKLQKMPGCESSEVKVLTQTLHYCESTAGNKIYIYVEDESAGGIVRGGSLSTRGVTT